MFSSQVNASFVQRAGDVGEIDPLEETMSRSVGFCKGLDFYLAINDRRHMTRRKGHDLFTLESKVQQRYILAGRSENAAIKRVAHGFDSQRITRHHHFAFGRNHGNGVSAVAAMVDVPHDFQKRRVFVFGENTTDFVKDDLGIGFPRQVVLVFRQQFITQLLVVGQLAIKGKTEPLGFLNMVSLERLSVIAIIGAAGCVTDMSDCSLTGVLFHQAIGFGFVA